MADSDDDPSKRRSSRWRWAARAAVVCLLAAAGVFLFKKRHEVTSGLRLLTHPSPGWLVGAVALEALSLLALARVQWLFLRAGDADIGTGEMAELTAAHNAITMSVPGGVAWSTAFVFDQLRRRGADRTLAAWSILASGAVSSFCLFLLLAAGIELTRKGPAVAAKVPIAILASIPPVLAAVAVVLHHRGVTGKDVSEGVQSLGRRVGGAKAGDWVARQADNLERYRPSPFEWTRTFILSFANWLADLGCLVFCIEALGGTAPWPGTLLAYALAKVAGILPITPGGLGVVEAGLSGLLVVYGMPPSEAIGVTLLYRLISFWALLPVGWGYWGFVKLQERAGAT